MEWGAAPWGWICIQGGFGPLDEFASRDKLSLWDGFSPRCAFAPCSGMNLHPGTCLHPGMNSHPGMGLYLEMGLYPGEGLTQLWVCTLQWDEFASRGVFALQREGMEGMSGTRRPPGSAALRSCLEPVPAAGCPVGAVSHTGQGVAVPVGHCYPGSFGKRIPHQWHPRG